MKLALRTLAASVIAAGIFSPGRSNSMVSQAQQSAPGSQTRHESRHPLACKPTPGATKPEFTSVTVFPGRALMLQQVTANFPGKGEVKVLAEPLGDLDAGAKNAQ